MTKETDKEKITAMIDFAIKAKEKADADDFNGANVFLGKAYQKTIYLGLKEYRQTLQTLMRHISNSIERIDLDKPSSSYGVRLYTIQEQEKAAKKTGDEKKLAEIQKALTRFYKKIDGIKRNIKKEIGGLLTLLEEASEAA